LEHIKWLTDLADLTITGTAMTEDGIANLQKVLPKVKVHR
jgi:hypothetical protein